MLAYDLVSDKTEEEKNDQMHSTANCTNKWLAAICFLIFLQAIVVVTIAATGVVVYNEHEEDIVAWRKLDWRGMANTVNDTYNEVEQHPVGLTLKNVHSASKKLDGLPFEELKNISQEILNHKMVLDQVNQLFTELVPAMERINTMFQGTVLIDIEQILRDYRSDRTKKFLNSSEALLHKVNNVLTVERVDSFKDTFAEISATMNRTLTTSNINKTLTAMEDFDNTLHRAETTASKIGLILGKT